MDLSVNQLLERNEIFSSDYLYASGKVCKIESVKDALSLFVEAVNRGDLHYNPEVECHCNECYKFFDTTLFNLYTNRDDAIASLKHNIRMDNGTFPDQMLIEKSN